jgi:hypothetical protein
MYSTQPNPQPPLRRRRALQASARATLLWSAAGILLGQGLFRLAIDNVWPELRDPAFEIKARRLDRILGQHPQGAITVLMTGSSVTSNAFKAKHLEDELAGEVNRDVVVFNMGCHGGGSLTQLMWMRRLIERGVRPAFACIELSPQLYDDPQIPSDASRFPAHVLTKQDLNTIRPYVADKGLLREWRMYRCCPAYFHRLTILNCAATHLVPIKDRITTWGGTIDERCWTEVGPRPKEEQEGNVRYIKNVYEQRLKQFTPCKASVQALGQLLVLLKGEKIPAAVVMVPQSQTIRQLYPHVILDAFVTQVADLCEANGSRFVNAFAWLEEEHFTDGIHPVSAGAEIFSARLKRELLLPALTKHKKAS